MVERLTGNGHDVSRSQDSVPSDGPYTSKSEMVTVSDLDGVFQAIDELRLDFPVPLHDAPAWNRDVVETLWTS